MNTPLLLLLAFLPGIALAIYIYLRDRQEPEPSGMLLISIIYGVLSYFMALGLGYLLHNFIYVPDDSWISQAIRAFLFVGLLSEGMKFLFLRGVIFYSKNFNQPFDGIVYAVMIGIGYGTTENILYVLNTDVDTAVVRIITTVPAQAVFSVIMGFFLGQAKMNPNRNFLFSLLALLLAAFAHGYYDYFLHYSHIRGLWMQAIVSVILVVMLTQFALNIRKKKVISQ